MKFFLLNSPIYRDRSDAIEDYLPPLGLGYIATQLSYSGINVRIVDCVKERLGIKDIQSLLKEQKPDYIGINIFTQNYDIVKEIIEGCPLETTMVVGGQMVKYVYNEILHWHVHTPLVAIIGEGELIVPAIALGNCVEKPIACHGTSVAYRVDRNSKYYPGCLDSIHLNRSLLKDDIVMNHYKQKEAAIITSRGCMYNCAFCGGANNLNREVSIRFRNPKEVGEEISEIIRLNPEVASIRVLDDLFLRNEASIKDAIELFGNCRSLTWRGMAHILTFAKTLHCLPSLKESGCRELFVGIESWSIEMREKIHKAGTPTEVFEVISALLQAGINVKGYFMYGFPNETANDADYTFALAKKLTLAARGTSGRFRLSVFQFRPYHGTQLYNEIIESGRKIKSITRNDDLNIMSRRSQFNFQSGNYSSIEDSLLNDYILKTQGLSEVHYA